jgi:hypothetical protein
MGVLIRLSTQIRHITCSLEGRLVGGAILALWLIFGNLDIPLHGRIFLWLLVFVLVLISTIELLISKYSNVD